MERNKLQKQAAPFGTDPFGAGELTDKVRFVPQAGGDSHTGVLEPSDSSKDHHMNDYFSEGDHTPTTERALDDLRDKKKKKKLKFKKKKLAFNLSKYSQWGVKGPKLPVMTPDNWYRDSYADTPAQNVSLKDKKKKHKKLSLPASENMMSPVNSEADNYTKVLDVAQKSTVTIEAQSGETGEVGAGFFIAPDMVLTCAHVVMVNEKIENTVNDAVASVSIVVKHGEKAYEGHVIKADPELDVALLRVNQPEVPNAPPLQIGNSSEAKLGEPVVAFGTPLGFEGVANEGIVSSNPTEYREGGNNITYMFVSSTLLPGNSGGPVLLKRDNSVIGIAAASISSSQNAQGALNAIIPMDVIVKWMNESGTLNV